MDITDLLVLTKKNDASDLHMAVGCPPMLRMHGEIVQQRGEPLSVDNIKAMLYSIMTEQQRSDYERDFEIDFAISFGDNVRFRINAFNTIAGPAAVLRTIPTKIIPLVDLNAPDVLIRLASLHKGMVLVTGPTGSGKSTTLAGMIDYINTHHARHIITIEDPVEFIHTSKKSLINQREVGRNTKSFARALKSALREDPDVILVGELRDIETIQLALTAAETGHLVFGTLHTSSAAKTIDRIIDVFPAGDKEMVRAMLSASLEAVIAQTLLKKKDGGRIAAHEIMLGTSAVRNLIREGKIPQLYSMIQMGSKLGMSSMKDSIYELLKKDIITQETARDALATSVSDDNGDSNAPAPAPAPKKKSRKFLAMAFQIDSLIDELIKRKASDLYLTVGAHPALRTAQGIVPIGQNTLVEEDVQAAIKAILPESVIDEFSSTLEYNTAIDWKGEARLRINLFRQKQRTGMVMRRITSAIPDFRELGLPSIYGDLVMEKRGLILLVGPTGAGKSSSLASMLEYRNTHGSGHIVTLEDPVEFLLDHKNCIVTQRDVGIDTYSFGIGLKNTLRQAPDIIVIGEIRDREAMEHAIVFAETGHLCLATLHSNNANQAIERIINFFPEEKHSQVLLNLSFNLRAILSQRLMPNTTGGRSVAIEIMLNQGLVRQLIHDGKIREIKECIEKGRDQGMQAFDQHLVELVESGTITEDTAIAEADTPSNVRLALKQLSIARRHDVGELHDAMKDKKAF